MGEFYTPDPPSISSPNCGSGLPPSKPTPEALFVLLVPKASSAAPMAGNFLPSAEWEGLKEREGVGDCRFFFTAVGSRRVAVCCLEGRGQCEVFLVFKDIYIFMGVPFPALCLP